MPCLKDHIRTMHLTDKHYTCQYCGKQFAFRRAMEFHIDRHHPETGEPTFPCEVCGVKFIYSQSVKLHQFEKCKTSRNPRLNPSENFRCTSCGSEVTVRGLYRHYKTSHPEETLPKNVNLELVCRICEDVFATKYELMTHLSQSHSANTKGEMCPFCNVPLDKNHDCNAAVPKVASQTRKQCPFCDYTIVGSGRLEEHISRIHEKKLPFKCKLCPKKFASVRLMNAHFRNSHLQQECDICHKTLSSSGLLRLHKFKVHKIGEGAIYCLYCPKNVFFTQTKLELHMRTYHKDLKPT